MALPVAALAAIIAVAAAVAIAATVFAIYKLWKNKKKDKDQGNGEDKNKKEEKEKGKGKEDDRGKDKDKTKGQKSDDKSVSTQDTESVGKPKTNTFTLIDKKSGQKHQVQGVLGEDGRYHVDGSQLFTKKNIQESLTTMKNSTNNSINETKQQQEEFNKKISDISKELETAKAKLAEQQQTKLQVDQLSAAIGAAAPSVIDSVFSKLNNFDLTPALNAVPLTTKETINEAMKKENDLPEAPPVVNTKEDVIKDIEPKVIKQEVTTSLTEANKAKEEAQGNSL